MIFIKYHFQLDFEVKDWKLTLYSIYLQRMLSEGNSFTEVWSFWKRNLHVHPQKNRQSHKINIKKYQTFTDPPCFEFSSWPDVPDLDRRCRWIGKYNHHLRHTVGGANEGHQILTGVAGLPVKYTNITLSMEMACSHLVFLSKSMNSTHHNGCKRPTFSSNVIWYEPMTIPVGSYPGSCCWWFRNPKQPLGMVLKPCK